MRVVTGTFGAVQSLDGTFLAQSIEIHRLPLPVEQVPKAGRRKLWDIPHKYHCPVIGTCLSVEELRRVASRFLLRGDAPSTD